MAEKKSIKEFAAQLREEYDIPKEMSDAELVKRYAVKHPDEAKQALGGYQVSKVTGQTRSAKEIFSNKNAMPYEPPKPEGGFLSRLFGGAWESVVGNLDEQTKATEETLKNQPQQGQGKGFFATTKEGFKEGFSQIGSSLAETAKHPSTLVDTPNTSKDIENKNYAGAAGRIGIQSLLLASMLKGTGVLGGAGKAAEGGELSKFTKITDKITQPIQDLLNAQGEMIKGSMDGKLVNVAKLRGNPMFKKLTTKLAEIEHAPNTKVTDVKAAREALEELANQVNSGKATSWNDLFEMNKKLRAANAAMKDPATNAAIRKITDIADEGLSDGAKAAGQDKPYETWRKNYADFKEARRNYEEVLKGKTDAQMERKATAKSTKAKVLGTDFGSPKVNKIAKTNVKMVKQSHKAFDELHKRIKSAPMPAKPTTPPPPAAPAAPSGPGAPPGGTPPSVSGGSSAAATPKTPITMAPPSGRSPYDPRTPLMRKPSEVAPVPRQVSPILGTDIETMLKEADRLGIKPFGNQ